MGFEVLTTLKMSVLFCLPPPPPHPKILRRHVDLQLDSIDSKNLTFCVSRSEDGEGIGVRTQRWHFFETLCPHGVTTLKNKSSSLPPEPVSREMFRWL